MFSVFLWGVKFIHIFTPPLFQSYWGWMVYYTTLFLVLLGRGRVSPWFSPGGILRQVVNSSRFAVSEWLDWPRGPGWEVGSMGSQTGFRFGTDWLVIAVALLSVREQVHMMTHRTSIYQYHWSLRPNLQGPIEALLIYVQPWVAVSLRQLRIDRVKTGSGPLWREFELSHMEYLYIYITYIMLESQQQTHLGIVYSMRWWWFWGWFIFGLPTLLPLPYATNVDPGASVGVIRLHTFL